MASESIRDEITRPLVQVGVVAGLSSLLFGYDSAVTAGVLIGIQDQLGELSNVQLEWIVSSALAAAMLGSLIASPLVDWSRKYSIVIGAALFTLGALEQAASTVYADMILGRVLVGIAIGITSQSLPMYLGELASPRVRGRMVAMIVVAITAGQVLAYVVDAVFLNVHDGFRWMTGVGALPAIAQLLLSFTIPESPRLDVYKGRLPTARKTLKVLHPKETGDEIQERIERIQLELAASPSPFAVKSLDGFKSRIIEWFSDVKTNTWHDRVGRRTVLVACTLQFFQQATGFNAIVYYSGSILQNAGFSNPILAALVVTIANLICTVVALRLIDTVGRRTLLLRTLPGMMLGMLFVGFCFFFLDSTANSRAAGVWAYLSVVSMTAFTCSYALGLGHVVWVVQSEIFSPQVRATGSALSTTTNWLTNFIVAATFLRLKDAITATGIFWVYGAVAGFAWLFTYFSLPETKGRELDDIRVLFGGDGGHEDRTGAGQYAAVEGDEERYTVGSDDDDDSDDHDEQRREVVR